MHYFKRSVPSHAILVCLRFPTADAHSQTHTVEPRNTWKRLDDTATILYLNCTIQYTEGVPISTQWSSYHTGAGVPITLNEDVLPGFGNDFFIDGTHNLIFPNPSLTEAGQYGCRNSLPPYGANKQAEVIILGEFWGLGVSAPGE